MNPSWIGKYDTLLESLFHFQLVPGKQNYLCESVKQINAAAACTSLAAALFPEWQMAVKRGDKSKKI